MRLKWNAISNLRVSEEFGELRFVCFLVTYLISEVNVEGVGQILLHSNMNKNMNNTKVEIPKRALIY